jgi:hypothetical protein
MAFALESMARVGDGFIFCARGESMLVSFLLRIFLYYNYLPFA